MEGNQQETTQMTEEEASQLRRDLYYGTTTSPESSEDVPADDMPEIKPEETAETNIPADDSDDPWAGVPAALRQQIEGISNRLSVIDNLGERLKQAERRIGAIQNDFHNAQKVAAELKKKEIEAPTKQEIEDAAKSDKAWKTLEDEFPEWASAIEGKLSKIKPPDLSEIRREIQGLAGSISSLQENTVAPEAIEIRLLNFAHPDWRTVVATPDYKEWVNKQTDEVKRKAFEGKTAEEASDVLTMFKDFQRTKTQKKSPDDIVQTRTNKLRKSTETSGQGGVHRPPVADAHMTDREYREKVKRKYWPT